MEEIVSSTTAQIPSSFALPLPTQGKRWTGFYRSILKKAKIDISQKKTKYIQKVKEKSLIP
ncbi:8774_t:CDS:2, partial [Scutellospora calospora]